MSDEAHAWRPDDVREAIVLTLANAKSLEDERAIKFLGASLTRYRRSYVGVKVARVLGEAKAKQATWDLVETLEHGAYEVSQEAVRALTRITGQKLKTADQWRAWLKRDGTARDRD